jgi:quercetin dioxygenase-like cupin family protein
MGVNSSTSFSGFFKKTFKTNKTCDVNAYDEKAYKYFEWNNAYFGFYCGSEDIPCITRLPNDITVGEYCTLFRESPITIYDHYEPLLFALFVINLILAIDSFQNRKNYAVFLLILVFLFVRMCPPQQNYDYNEEFRTLSLRSSELNTTRSLDEIEEFPGIFVSHSVVDTKNSASKQVENIRFSPNSQLPFHKHSNTTVSVAETDGLEYTFDNKTWSPWPKGKIVFIPANKKHTVRAGPEGGVVVAVNKDYAFKDFKIVR